MDSVGHVVVPLRVGGKKMRKRRELDALVAHSLAKRSCSSGKKQVGNGITSQDQLLSQSTDDQEESTWSKVPITSTGRCRAKRYNCIRLCCMIVLLTSVMILFGLMYWLYFDLRQQIYDQRMQLEQVSAGSHLLPNTLQKWHVASKALEQNQTNINNKLQKMQTSLSSIEKELTVVREQINKKNGSPSNKDQLMILQNNMADFGAKMKDISINVAGLKEHLQLLQEMDNDNKQNLTKLTDVVFKITGNYTHSSADISVDIVRNMIKNVSDSFANDLRQMYGSLRLINETLSQRTQGSDDDLNAIKPKVEALIENFANMSSHVTSIEDDWTKYKQKAFVYENNSNQLNSDILRLKNNTDKLANTLSAMQMENMKKSPVIATPPKEQNQTATIETPPKLVILLSAAATDAVSIAGDQPQQAGEMTSAPPTTPTTSPQTT